MSAETVAYALGPSVKVKGGFNVRCPVPTHGKGNGDSHPSLNVSDDASGRLRVKCFAGCSHADVFEALRERGLLDVPAPSQPRVWLNNNRERALAVWRQAVAISQTPAHDYILWRGLDLTIEAQWVLRFHPRCPFTGRMRRPAMVALMTNWSTGEPSGIIRTALQPDGRGKGDKGRQSLGTMRGAAVMLTDGPLPKFGPRLTITEGVETAIAAQLLGLGPVWALGNEGGVRWFPVLDGIDHLIISRERDPVGEKSADTCARRWLIAGRRVEFAVSPAGKDLADYFFERAHG